MTARPVRMLEVAAAAGVSRATVSLVMRDDPSIPEATRERVLRAARDIGYVYDRRAARLRSQTSNVVGLVVTDNANPFFAEFAEALESRLHTQGQTILLGFTHDDLDRQHSVVQRLVEDRVAGIVLVPAIGTTSASLADAVSATSVVLATRPMDVPGASYVGTDDEHGGRLAGQHLIDHGVRSMAFFGGLGGSTTRRARSAGFSAVAAEAGVAIDPVWHVDSDPGAQVAFDLASELLRVGEVPEAIACNSDPIAYGVMRAVTNAGLRVGQDVRVIGFDNLRYSALWDPGLSSVAAEPRILGEWAAELVLGSSSSIGRRVHRPHLALRESCGCHE